MSDLVAFLRARLDEDEQLAKATGPLQEAVTSMIGGTPLTTGMGERVLREVAAKRAILAEHPREPWYTADTIAKRPELAKRASCGRCHDTSNMRLSDDLCAGFDWPCPTLRHLTAVYSGHPDYDPAWA